MGAALLLASGFTMVGVLRGGVVGQLWFSIKMVLVVLIFLNSFLVSRPQIGRLRTSFAGNSTAATAQQLASVRQRVRFFYPSQFMLFVLVFILSVFRFT